MKRIKFFLIFCLLLLIIAPTIALADTTSQWNRITTDSMTCIGLSYSPNDNLIAGFRDNGIWAYNNGNWEKLCDYSILGGKGENYLVVVNQAI